jgi:hypothetical protein
MVIISIMTARSRDSSVGIVLGYGLEIWVLEFDSWWELEIFLFTTTSAALGPTQPPTEWVPQALSLGVKWPGREADRSPSSSAKIKE